jgi:PAS domain S-box-containing protein
MTDKAAPVLESPGPEFETLFHDLVARLQKAAGRGSPGPVLSATQARSILKQLGGSDEAASTCSRPSEGVPSPSAADRAAEAGTARRLAAPPVSAAALTADTLHRLLQALPDALVVSDSAGRIILINAQTEAMFGYRAEELIGQAVEVLVPERLRQPHVAHRAGYMAAPTVKPMGQRLALFGRRKDGREIAVEISLSPLPTAGGLLIVSTIRDVGERLLHAAQVKKLEARYRALVEGIPAVTFMAAFDEEARELYVSPQVEELLGFSQKEWLENPVLWYTQLHPEDRRRWHEEFALTCASSKPFRSVYRFLSRDGRVVWVQGEAEVVRDKAGRPLFLQGVAFDITAIKEATVELDRRVQERTQELNQALAELHEQNEELKNFAQVASHDLREPLRTLVNYPQLLTKHYSGKLDSQADEWINRIIDGGKRMRDLIEDLAKYARLLPRDRTFNPVNAAAACGEAGANLEEALKASGAELTVGELPMVMGNDKQLMLLFQNLIGNAVKFRADDRPVRVDVGSRRDGDGWLFWVRDNGIGIRPKYLKQIFGLGERLHPSSKYPGTGFGLAICERIVLGHGGRIWAESEPGKGSTFFFTLPGGSGPV